MLNAIINMSGRTKPQFFGISPTAHINDCLEQTSIWAVSGSHRSTAQPLILMVPYVEYRLHILALPFFLVVLFEWRPHDIPQLRFLDLTFCVFDVWIPWTFFTQGIKHNEKNSKFLLFFFIFSCIRKSRQWCRSEKLKIICILIHNVPNLDLLKWEDQNTFWVFYVGPQSGYVWTF